MEEFLLGLVVGGLLCGAASRRVNENFGLRITGWLNQKRQQRLQRKAKKLGFEAEFLEEFRDYEHIPFGLLNSEQYRAFHRAKARHQQVSNQS